MAHSLLLNLPDNIYDSLIKLAMQIGQKPETFAVQYLSTLIENKEVDPLDKFIGAFNSNIPDWADEHDKYIGQSIMETMTNKDSEAN